MYKKIIGIFALAFAFMLSQASFADSSICGEGMKKMVESLNLDDSQKEKINPILDQLKSNLKASWSQMKDLQTKIHEQSISANMDQSAVNNLVDQKTKLIGEMIKNKLAAKNQIYNLLNDEQKKKMQTKIDNLEKKMEEKFKKCHEED
jgi:protein CpxP